MKKIIVTTQKANQRLDKFLAEEFFSLSRGEIIRQIKNQKVLVNGQVVKPSREISQNDVIEMDFELEEKKLKANGDLPIEIIFEDENILVLNKPFGIQMHPSAVEKEKTLANWLLAQYPEIENVHDESEEGYLRPGIVHRLDKDTSGLVVVAKNQKSFDELKRLFAQREMTKKYWAIVWGNLQEKQGKIEKPLARATDFRRQKVAVGRIRGKVRSALTLFRVLESQNSFDLIEAEPKTGRMHQIRIHFFSISHPIVGDKKYFLRKYKNLPIAGQARRQLLHARELHFELWGQKYDFVCPPPQDFEEFWKNID